MNDEDPPDDIRKILTNIAGLMKGSQVISRYDTSRGHNGNPFDYSGELTKGELYFLENEPEIEYNGLVKRTFKGLGISVTPSNVHLTVRDDSNEIVDVPACFFRNISHLQVPVKK